MAEPSARIKFLTDLESCGGVFDRYLRVVARGRHAHKETVLTCFRDALVVVENGRVVLTEGGRAALKEARR